MASWDEMNRFLAAQEVAPLPEATPAAQLLIRPFPLEDLGRLPEPLNRELARAFAGAARRAHDLRMSFIPESILMRGELGSPRMNHTDIQQAMLAAGVVIASLGRDGFVTLGLLGIPCDCLPWSRDSDEGSMDRGSD